MVIKGSDLTDNLKKLQEALIKSSGKQVVIVPDTSSSDQIKRFIFKRSNQAIHLQATNQAVHLQATNQKSK